MVLELLAWACVDLDGIKPVKDYGNNGKYASENNRIFGWEFGTIQRLRGREERPRRHVSRVTLHIFGMPQFCH